MRSRAEKRKAMKRRLHAGNPYCRFCGKRTRLIAAKRHQREPDDMAVLVHIYTRDMPDRWTGDSRGPRRSELVCRACADDYGNGVHTMQPIEKLWESSGSYPRDLTS